MHVLHVVDGLALGGAERMVVELANRTVADGNHASVCITRAATDLAHLLDPRVVLVVLARRRRAEILPLLRLAKWIRTHDVDVVHCHGRSSFSLVATLAATHLISAPVILHDHLGVQAHPEVPMWFRMAQRYLSAYVGVDAAQLPWAKRAGISPARARVISNAIDLVSLAQQTVTGPPLALRDGVSRIVCIGGLRHEKAIEVVVDAISMIRRPVVLHVIGGDADPAYAQKCRDRVQRAKLQDRISFEGARTDALALARTATFAVHGARSESGPLVLAEYAALGIPFVATRVGGIANALAEAGLGRFVLPDDAEGLAAAIDEMLALPRGDLEQRGLATIAPAQRMFDLRRVVEQWYRLYFEVAR